MVLAATQETRQVFERVGLGGKTVFYVASLLVTGVFAWGWSRRVRKYRQGRSAGRRGVNIVDRLYVVASNRTVRRRNRGTGFAHLLVFWGFITLFLGTVVLTIDYDIVRHATRLIVGREHSFYKGLFYVAYKFVINTMGLAAVGGTAYLAWRRRFAHQPALDYTRAEQPVEGYSRAAFVRGDWLFLDLLFVVLVTGFLHEGLRIRASRFPTFEVWSWVGWVAARAVQGVGITAATASDLRLGMWWIHISLALAFIAYIPFSKAMHMVTDAGNLATHDASSARRLPAPIAVDHPGYQTITDLTWKELLDLDACTKCGRCHVVCPAAASGAPLSPRDVILDLRQFAERQSHGFTLWDGERRPVPSGPLAADGRLAGAVIKAETLWSCTTCMACMEACPVGIEHVPTIVNLRRTLVDEGNVEPTLQAALQSIAQQGNSFGKSNRMRPRWTKGLDSPIPDARNQPVRYLWFVGDFASFDERLQELSRTLARILQQAGVDFGILYEGERNAGNDVRRVGEEGLFEMLVEHNMAAFGSASFEEIFTTDPHSYNTLRNEYPLTKPVRHYSELLADLLESGQLPLRPLGLRVTYHDPCYLARYNGLTDAPRRVLAALGCELVEMPRNRDNTFCCGAGGGRIWMDDSGLTERPSENRIREAAALDVERFVVACPKDFTMYTDAAKTTGHDAQLRVVDLVQLVQEALVTTPLATADSL